MCYITPDLAVCQAAQFISRALGLARTCVCVCVNRMYRKTHCASGLYHVLLVLLADNCTTCECHPYLVCSNNVMCTERAA